MPEPLKNEFNESFVKRLAENLVCHDSSFDVNGFYASIINTDWESRELKDRMRHISKMIHGHTELDYLDQLKVMLTIADQFRGMIAMTFPDYVEVFGLEYVSESLDALEYMTQFSSSEFAIRPFVVKDEKKTMERMLLWSTSENEHIRRLASEGCRPRLPWAMALPSFKSDPSLILTILNNLRQDDSLYVRKSVANNINDVTKDNPDIALALAESWYGENSHTNWIVKHGLRTLLKKGNVKALQIIGFNDKAQIAVDHLILSDKKVKMGDSFHFEFQVLNLEPNASYVKIGFAVAYMKANGKRADKIFHVSEKEIVAAGKLKFKKKLSFKDLSTRKHYPGEHRIGVLVNGKKLKEETFELLK